MDFSWWFSIKIAFGKGKKNNLSGITILIGQITVTIGILVAILTVAVGTGSGKAIKEKLGDFEGHITITAYNNNKTFDTQPIPILSKNINEEDVEHVQVFAIKSGIIRTEKHVEGIVFKGVSNDFDKKRFEKYLISGEIPVYDSLKVSNQIMLSKKLTNKLGLKLGNKFVIVFPNNDKALYRKFTLSGIYATDIHFLDDLFVIGDLKHVQKLNKWNNDQVGGVEVFLKDIGEIEKVSEQVFNKISFDLYSQSAIEKYQTIQSWIKLFDVNILIILSLMMLVISFNISMVFIIIVVERTNSIGVLKALGANNWKIMRVFINYSILVMLPGILIGNILGIGLLVLQNQYGLISMNPDLYFVNKVPVYFNFGYFLMINLGCILFSAIVLLVPSFMIARIQPSTAINFK